MLDHLGTEQQVILSIVFLAGMLIMVELGRFGIGLLSLRPSARVGVVTTLVALGIGMARDTFVADGRAVAMMLVGWSISYLVARFRRSPLTRLAKALLEMRQWQKYYYSPGEMDESKARSLREFAKAQETVSDFKTVIEAFENHESNARRVDVAVAHGELGYLYRMMGLCEKAQEEMDEGMSLLFDLDQTCPTEKMLSLTKLNWERIAVPLSPGSDRFLMCKSLPWLKKMNRTFFTSGEGPPPGLANEIRHEAGFRKHLVEQIATLYFRSGELAQILGDQDQACMGYEQAIAMFEGLGRVAEAEAVRGQMKKLSGAVPV